VAPDPRFPEGRIKYGLNQKRAGGWYVTLVTDGEPKPVPLAGENAPAVGVDFGFATLVTLSTGEKI
jgi:transposase